MSDSFDDLTGFLQRRFADREDPDTPEWGILLAIIEWAEAGCPPPPISVVYRAAK